jgi:hypothetical protein
VLCGAGIEGYIVSITRLAVIKINMEKTQKQIIKIREILSQLVDKKTMTLINTLVELELLLEAECNK